MKAATLNETVKQRRLALHDLVLMCAVLVGAGIVLFRDDILPPRFFGDGEHIRLVALGSQDGFGDQSFVSVATIYRSLGLASNGTMAAFFGYIASILILLLMRFRLSDRITDWMTTAFLAVTVLLSAVFLGYYSKDVFVLIATALVLMSTGKRFGDVLLIGWIVSYGFLFRNYWLVVAVLFVAYLALLQTKHPRRNAILGTAAALLFASIALSVFLGVSPDHFRAVVNAGRLDGADSASLIRPFVSLPEPLGGTLNNALTLLSLMIPLPLASLGGVYYLGLSVLITSIWILFWNALRTSARDDSLRKDPTLLRAIALVLSFVVTQSLFEPDYGSYLRHLTPLLPCMLYAIWAMAGIRMEDRLQRLSDARISRRILR